MIEAQVASYPVRRHGAVWLTLLVLGSAYVGSQIVTGKPVIRVIAAVAVMAALAVPAMRNPRAALTMLFVGLPFLGVFRHMFLQGFGAARLDPLLLISSAVAIVVFVSLVLSNEMDFGGTPLSFLVFCLLFVGVVQVFNPYQGPTATQVMLVGLTGVMINLIPITFFFIARSIADAQYTHRIFKIVFGVGIVAAIYGLKQVYFGFFGFETAFVKSQGYTALQVSGTTRPFSIFNNAAEYASYMHIACVLALAMLLFARKNKKAFLIGAAGAIFYAGFLIGSRGFTVKVIAAAIILLAARARNKAVAAGIVMMLVSGLLWWSATAETTGTIQEKNVGADQLIEQQLQALRDPLDRRVSTLPLHWEQATTGIKEAVTNLPFGLGTGVATRGGEKFGGLQAGTELDIGDAFLSLGVVGGILYVLVILRAIWQASKVRKSLPGPVWIGVWAAVATSVGAWLIGGNYAVTPLIWFFIGASDGAYKRLRERRLLDGTLVA